MAQKGFDGMPIDIVETLVSMRSGQVVIDLNKKFSELITAVKDTGGKGNLTVTLHVEPSKLGMGATVLEVKIEHETKMKKPELPIGPSLFYLAADGSLSRDAPDQANMFSPDRRAQ